MEGWLAASNRTRDGKVQEREKKESIEQQQFTNSLCYKAFLPRTPNFAPLSSFFFLFLSLPMDRIRRFIIIMIKRSGEKREKA